MPVQTPQADMGMNGPFGNLDNSDVSVVLPVRESQTNECQNFPMSLEFGNLENGDVLDNFDFDSFLNNDGGDPNFAFDANLAFGGADGLEAGGDV